MSLTEQIEGQINYNTIYQNQYITLADKYFAGNVYDLLVANYRMQRQVLPKHEERLMRLGAKMPEHYFKLLEMYLKREKNGN